MYIDESTVLSWLSLQLLCGNSCTWAHDVVRFTLVPMHMNCHKVIVIIRGRALHDYIDTNMYMYICIIYIYVIIIYNYIIYYIYILCKL